MEQKTFEEVKKLIDDELQKQDVRRYQLKPVRVTNDCFGFYVIAYPNGEIEAVANADLDAQYQYDSKTNTFVGRALHSFIEWKAGTFMCNDVVFEPGGMVCVDEAECVRAFARDKFECKFEKAD